MIYNNQEEIWFELNNKGCFATAIKSISNRGRMKRKNGVIEEIPYRTMVRHNGERLFCYRLLLEHFKPKSLEDKILGRDVVDHITHNPVGMLINDVRNLRWCTPKENCNFEECRQKMSIAKQNMSDETKKKISNANKNRCDEWKRKLSESHKGKSPANKGVPMSEEQKKKISEANKGRHWRLENGVRVWYDVEVK